MDLREKYRPRVFEDVIGQPDAVHFLSGRARRRETGAYLLHGPMGCGKTSLARIYVNSLLCLRPLSSGSPCRECEGCSEFDAQNNWIALNGKKDSVARVRNALEQLRFGGLSTSRRIIVCDEVHALHPQSKEVLHSALEALPEQAAVVLCTLDTTGLSDDFRQRCREFRVGPVERPSLLDHGIAVCRKESIAFDEGALGLLVDAANGSPRGLIKLLEEFQDGIAPELVRSRLRLDFASAVVAYVAALVEGQDLATQCGELETWVAEPDEYRGVLERFFGHVFARKIVRRHRPDAVMDELPDDVIDKVAACIDAAARASGVDRRAFWERIVALWTPSPAPITAAVLDVKLSALDRVVEPGRRQSGSDAANPQSDMVPEHRRRVRKPRTSAKARSIYLSGRQVQEIWNTASFMTQEYGVVLNCVVELSVAKGASAGLPRLLTALTRGCVGVARALGAGADAHWLYVYRSVGDEVGASVALSFPQSALRPVIDQVRSQVVPPLEANGASVRVSAAPRSVRAPFEWQVMMLRKLSGGLDPSEHDWDGAARRRLIGILAVPQEFRVPVGPQLFPKRWGRSHTLSKKRISESLPYLSAFSDRAWDRIGDGWELLEFHDRRRFAQVLEEERRELERASTFSLFEPTAAADGPGETPRSFERNWAVWKKL